MILFVIFLNLFAQNVVIQSEDTTHFEYQKQLTEHPTQMSYIQHFETKPNHLKHRVLEELKKAQFEFLNGSLKKSEEHFGKIADLKHKTNWKKKERDAIHFSLLRLAQLTKNSEKQNSYLDQAATFNPSAKVDTTIFPPPLVAKYKTAVNKLNNQIWPLPKGSEKFKKILVNGKVRRGDSSFIELPSRTHRIQFISNQYLPVHFVVSPQDLEDIKLPLVPLATGPCQAPTFNPSLSKKSEFIYQKQGCTGKRNAFTQPLAKLDNNLATSSLPKKSRSFYKSKWFWIGLSVLATGALIAHQENQKRRSSPVYPTDSEEPPPPVQTFTNE